MQLSAVGFILMAGLLRIHTSHACKISEFPCRGGALCLPLDKYCDGRDDCGDASDEPKFCTGNSIYYQFVSHTFICSGPPDHTYRVRASERCALLLSSVNYALQ